MADQNQEKPKIIVDEDWKSQVEAEREACAQLCDHLWESKGSQAYECATAIRKRADE